MFPQSQFLTPHLPPSILPAAHFSKPSLSLAKTHFNTSRQFPCRKSLIQQPLRCPVSGPTHLELTIPHKPLPDEVSRTIMELSSVGTLSTRTQEGWPFGLGVRFALDSEGTSIICLNASNRQFSMDRRSTLHVQLEQCGLRTLKCTIQGSLDKPEDEMLLKDGIWITSSDYKLANPAPLWEFAERIVVEISTHNMEDVCRFCNIFVDLDFEVSEAKMVWVDRLGFDMRLSSPRMAFLKSEFLSFKKCQMRRV
ncbi:Glutamyl-tRNA reductase-binding protein [Actinidia chinensis var. chinensis]|uniref:Glutamyl-tRNA reductase-binding protein n=1 Tax=Actinidia chinensis var. chinensis TaxID=1590841 RepID=A0A2R6PT38_ACTCC|nr:Glutamyl-tRNA reductase-binding protein [Actinidia chinensis var. chinensis]